MNFSRFLAVRNCRRNAVRTFALGTVAGILALALFGGSLIMISLQNGLSRFQERLGADVIVLPREAEAAGGLEGVLVQGVPAHFYMEERYLDELRDFAGIAAATPQFFLASANAGCCSVAVQLIGFDPATDFTIQPWMRESYDGAIGFGDILVGSRISVPSDRQLLFYNTPCRVVGQLRPTGTGMDTAVYTNMETMRAMMANAAALNFDYFAGIPTENAISAVLIRTADGFTPEGMASAINETYPQLAACAANGMVHDVGQGLDGITGIISLLLVVIWLLAAIILGIAFRMVAHERRREFAILRIAGATRGLLTRLMMTEAAIVSAAGAAAGVIVGAVVLLPFAELMKEGLTRPYLLPDAGEIALIAAAALAVTILSGMLSAAWTMRRMAASDLNEILREDG
ncbi:FtsX-like permease family protein [Selenomonas sp. TAMA-11512]|uniref:FtsX-like permease family protein n=1 Tax=Selenomonas sp. TAMA-11512 TaxID=3095337 RepID=UPI00308E558C|nr:FtsX-like permease family protein [Selenomonas sp. TAMA-11512]